MYGHPDAGGYWEQKCDEHLLSVNFATVPNWPSCYLHPELRLFLTLCVDYFKMSGTPANLERGWKLIRQGTRMDDLVRLHRYVGCEHYLGNAVLDPAKFPLATFTQEGPGMTGPSEKAAGNVFGLAGVDGVVEARGKPSPSIPRYSSMLEAAPESRREEPHALAPPNGAPLKKQSIHLPVLYVLCSMI